MATPTASTEEPAEAIIISGPRKGEFIRVGVTDHEPALSPEADALLDQMVETARDIAERIQQTTRTAQTTLNKLRATREEINELLRPNG
jgi:hypothetical protein